MTKDVVQAILAAVPKILAEETRLDRKHGIDPGNNSTLMSAGVGEENVHETALLNELLSYDHASLQTALALLYYGQYIANRKFEPTLRFIQKQAMSKSEIVTTLMGKAAASRRYFPAAVAKLLRKNELAMDEI